ncbi:MAG: hypothetical protein HQK70_09200 [Desulfamplus sp.]|nr:hypothetical protein [Desulfamplus sp.]
MRYLLTIIIVLLIYPSIILAQDNKNYCNDKQSWKEWSELAAKYPHDMELQTLHAIRIGLCKKIEEKTISFETAKKIFNQLHDSVIKNTETKYKIRKDNSKL